MAEEILNAEVVPAVVEQQEKTEEKKPEIKMVTFEKTGWSCPETEQYSVIIGQYVEEHASDTLIDKIKTGYEIEQDGKKLICKKTLQDVFDHCYKNAEKLKVKNCAVVKDEEVFGWVMHFLEEDIFRGTDLYNLDGTKYVAPKPEPKETTKKTKSKSKTATSGSSTPSVPTKASPTFKPCVDTGAVINTIFKWDTLSIEEKKFRINDDSYFVKICEANYPDRLEKFKQEVDSPEGSSVPVEQVVAQEEPVVPPVEEPIESCPPVEDDSLPFDVDDGIEETDDELEVIDCDIELIDDYDEEVSEDLSDRIKDHGLPEETLAPKVEPVVEQPKVEEPKVEQPKEDLKQEPKSETNWAEDETPIAPKQMTLWDLD